MGIDAGAASSLLAPLQDAEERLAAPGAGLGDARGLAVFSAVGHIASVWTRNAPPALVSCGSGFTLTPLLASLAPGGTFDLLAISKRHNRLFRGDAHGLRPVRLRGMPAAIDEELWLEDHHRGVNAHGAARVGQGRVTMVGRGQGSDRDARDERLLRYFRLVDEAVREFTRFSRRPLIVAGPAYELAVYRAATQMRRVETIAVGSTDRLGPDELYRRCAPVVDSVLDRPRQAAIRRLDRILVATSVHEIQAALERSRVDTLFVRPDRLAWSGDGDGPTRAARDLHSEAISGALREGAEVFPAYAGELPDDASIAATLRF
jgi:hypothetical protein